jgi:hypothetical protein
VSGRPIPPEHHSRPFQRNQSRCTALAKIFSHQYRLPLSRITTNLLGPDRSFVHRRLPWSGRLAVLLASGNVRQSEIFYQSHTFRDAIRSHGRLDWSWFCVARLAGR